MNNELKQTPVEWLESKIGKDAGLNIFTLIQQAKKMEAELQSRPVGDVEGYLPQSKFVQLDSDDLIPVSDAIAALQAFKNDYDYEKQALTESCLQLTAEVERLKDIIYEYKESRER